MSDDDARIRRTVESLTARDRFSAWAGIEVLGAEDGEATVRMTARPEMVNGFGICHGGIIFSLADTAFAFAANACGKIALALEVNISYTAKVIPGDVLTARAARRSDGGRIGVYSVDVTNQDGATVAVFRGTVYKTGQMISN